MSDPEKEIQELEDEIVFQRAVLQSIDEHVEDRDHAVQQVRLEISVLKKRLKAARKRSATSGPSNVTSPTSSTSPSYSQLLSPNNHSQNSNSNTPSRAMNVNGYMNRQIPHDVPSSGVPASTPRSRPLPDLTSPLPSRKRTLSNHLEGTLATRFNGGNKSRRTTPSPYDSSTASPGTSSGDDEFANFDREFFANQRAAEKRMKQEKLDEEYARRLQNEDCANIVQSSSSGPSAFNRLSGIGQPSSSSTTSLAHKPFAQPRAGRRLPPTWDSTSSSRSTPIKSENPPPHRVLERKSNAGSSQLSHFSNFLNHSPKVEAKVKPEPRYSVPGSYRNDSSASDSDVEIIPPSAFRPNNRHSSANYGRNSQDPSYFRPSQVAGNASLGRFSPATTMNQGTTMSTLQHTLYGQQQRPDWSFSQTTMQQSGLGMRAEVYMPGTYPDQYVHSNAYSAASSSSAGYSGAIPKEEPEFGNNLDDFGLPFNNFDNYAGIYGRDYGYESHDAHQAKEDIKLLLENIKPDDDDLPAENREGTPDGLKVPLYEHQKLALTWLKSMEEGTNKGGILADDMGLGKTVSTLALLLSRPSEDQTRKTTLIVGPVALVRQWEREIRTKTARSHKFSVLMVHGQKKSLSWDDVRVYDIVLTTYGTLAAEYKRLQKYKVAQEEAGVDELDAIYMKKAFPLLGPKSTFYRIILDEAQYIKNKNTQAARAACTIKSIYRFCLTGTPMMNNVGELYSLIHFLRIKPYNAHTNFQEAFGKLTKGNHADWQRKRAMEKLQAVLKAMMLRRTKKSKIDGKPIITLPPKTEEIQHVVFDEDESRFYKGLETQTKIEFNKYLEAGTVMKNYSNMLVLLLRLRQACCHAHLINDFEQALPADDVMMELAQNLGSDVVRRLLEADGFECPICYDGVENPSIIIPCGHDACAACITSITDRAAQDNVADGNDGSVEVKCPTCRGKLDPRRLIDYDTFKKVHKPEADDGEDDETASEVSSTEEDDEVSGSDENDGDSDGDLRGFVVPDDVIDTDYEGNSADSDEGDDEAEVEPEPKPKKVSKGKKSSKKRSKKDKMGKSKKKKQHLSLAMLKKNASKSAKGRRLYMQYLREHWQPSAKVTRCVELLEQFQAEGEKTIVFSQFTSLLDLLQVPIDEKRWDMERYDGSMNAEARNDAVVRFTDKPDCKIMLVSLKAGNAGLNLVAASRVIVLDPFWNPYIEMQAVDRAYRIGQQKPVQVHRILIEGTVEDRIIDLQEQKRKLVDAALDEGGFKNIGRLDVAQLAYLFGAN